MVVPREDRFLFFVFPLSVSATEIGRIYQADMVSIPLHVPHPVSFINISAASFPSHIIQ